MAKISSGFLSGKSAEENFEARYFARRINWTARFPRQIRFLLRDHRSVSSVDRDSSLCRVFFVSGMPDFVT